MLHGSTLMLMALTTLTPGQVPGQMPVVGPTYPGAVIVGQPHYALPAPVHAQYGPVAVPAAGYPMAGFPAAGYPTTCMTPDGYRCSGLLADTVGPCAPSWNLGEKCQRIWNWLTYKSLYKTPCCFKTCAIYRPPLYEWFPQCVDGHPTAMPCLPPVNTCPSCLQLKPRFAPPPGCATCAPGLR